MNEYIRCFSINSELKHARRPNSLMPKCGVYSKYPAYFIIPDLPAYLHL
jgi:hypothetical protein